MILKSANKNIDFKKKFLERLSNTRFENPALNSFIYEVSLKGNLFIVGGYLRSLINDEQARDIDIIVNVSQKTLSHLVDLCFISATKNRVGGFKIQLEKLAVDVWSVEDNWAFRKQLIKNIESNLIEKISEGTFFNYDSLVLDLHSMQYNFKYYNECAKEKKLDIIKRNSKYKRLNPTREANILRAFYLKNKYNLNFSVQLQNYIIEQLDYMNLAFGDIKFRMLAILNQYPKYLDFLNEEILTQEIQEIVNNSRVEHGNVKKIDQAQRRLFE